MLRDNIEIAGCTILHEGNHIAVRNPHNQYQLMRKNLIDISTYNANKYVRILNINGDSNNFNNNDTIIINVTDARSGYSARFILNIYCNYQDSKSIMIRGTENYNFSIAINEKTFNYQKIDLDVYLIVPAYDTIAVNYEYHSSVSTTNNNDELNIVYCNDVYDSLPTISSTDITRRIHTEMYDSSYPTSGTWERGDRVINLFPNPGLAKAWVCITAGSPGTWNSEGNL